MQYAILKLNAIGILMICDMETRKRVAEKLWLATRPYVACRLPIKRREKLSPTVRAWAQNVVTRDKKCKVFYHLCYKLYTRVMTRAIFCDLKNLKT